MLVNYMLVNFMLVKFLLVNYMLFNVMLVNFVLVNFMFVNLVLVNFMLLNFMLFNFIWLINYWTELQTKLWAKSPFWPLASVFLRLCISLRLESAAEWRVRMATARLLLFRVTGGGILASSSNYTHPQRCSTAAA